MLFRQNKKIF